MLDNMLNHHLEASKKYKFKKFQAIAPIVPEIDPMWTFVLTYFYPDSNKVMKSHWLGRFSSKEELQIFCDMHEIKLDD